MKEKTNDILDKTIKFIQENKYIIIAIILFNILKDNYIFEVLDILNDYMLPFCELHVGYLILFLSLLFIIFVFKNYRVYISASNFLLSFLIIWIYIYYRVVNTNFEFYKIAYEIAYTDIPLVIFVCFILSRIRLQFNIVKKQGNKTQDEFILKDDPIESEEDDELGFNSLVNLFYDNLIGIERSNNSFSAGVVASWGKGKSSFLNLLANKAKKDGNIVVRFNPRVSKKVDNIQEEFFNTFSNELSKYYLNIRYNINNYIRALKILDNNIVNVFIDIFSTLNPNTEKDKINDAIVKIGKKIFIIIEDLDRLTKDEILEVFKIIDVNADFKNTIFVSAYDKNYINNILEKEIGKDNSKDYTDKYFSYEIILPEITKSKLVEIGEKYLEKALINIGKYVKYFNYTYKDDLLNIWNFSKYNIPESYKELYKSIDNFGNYAVEYIYTIRDLKRYINLLLHSYKYNFEYVNPKEFLLCTLIKFKDPSLYNRLSIGYHILEEYKYDTQKNKSEKIVNLFNFSKWKYSKDVLNILFKENNNIYNKNFGYYFDAIYKYSSFHFEDLLNSENINESKDKALKIYNSEDRERLIEFLRIKAKIGLDDNILKRFIYLIIYLKKCVLDSVTFNDLCEIIFTKKIVRDKAYFTDDGLDNCFLNLQEKYYENIENNKMKFSATNIIISYNMVQESNSEIYEKAIENLFNFIINYADEFAKDILFYDYLYDAEQSKYSKHENENYVYYIKLYTLNIFDNPIYNITKNNYDKLKIWIDKIENEKLKYIMKKIIEFDNNVNIYVENKDSKYFNKQRYANKIDEQDIDFIYNKLKEMENSSN